jgi:hypothetical protein
VDVDWESEQDCHISKQCGGSTRGKLCGIDTLAHEAVKCWKCGMLGHFARDCPKEPGAGSQLGAGLNVLFVQGTSPENNILIVTIQNQVSLQASAFSCVGHNHPARRNADECVGGSLSPLSRRGNHAAGHWRIHAFVAVDSVDTGVVISDDPGWSPAGGLRVRQHEPREGYLGPCQHSAGFADGPSRQPRAGFCDELRALNSCLRILGA